MAKVGPHVGIKKIPKNYLACSRGLGDHKNVFGTFFKRALAPN
jgi:hypothetical protein